MRGIMRPDAGAACQVKEPDDIGVERPWCHGRRDGSVCVTRHHVRALVLVWAIVPIGHSMRVQAHDLAPAADNIDSIALHRGRRGHATVWPIVKPVLLAFWHDELPKQ